MRAILLGGAIVLPIIIFLKQVFSGINSNNYKKGVEEYFGGVIVLAIGYSILGATMETNLEPYSCIAIIGFCVWWLYYDIRNH